MNYQELFARAGLVQTKTAVISGLGEILLKKPDAALALAREQLILQSEKDADGSVRIEPMRLALLTARHCVVDADGKPFLNDDLLMALPADTVYEIYNAVSDLDDAAQPVDDAAKKS